MKNKALFIFALVLMLAACSTVGIKPQKTADKFDGVGVMWVGRKSHRMPCVTYSYKTSSNSTLGVSWSCDWSKCGPDNECLDGLPDFGEVFGEGE